MGSTKTIPHISVIMPVFNGRHFIELAVRSIINQTYKSFELLIIDDGSHDDSWEIIQKLHQEFPKKIRIFKLYKNSGAFRATNFAIKFSRGEFIALMDCDDLAHPERLEKQIKYLKKNPKVSILGTQAKIINQTGDMIGFKQVPLSHKDIYKEFGVLHPMIHPSCMIRKKLSNGREFGYTIKYGVNDDYFTFFRLLGKEEFNNLDEQLLFYRIHMNNSSFKNIKKKFFNSLKIRYEAYKKMNYKFSFKSLSLILAQTLIIFSLPERVTFYVYLLSKRIVSPAYVFGIVLNKININIRIINPFTSTVNSKL